MILMMMVVDIEMMVVDIEMMMLLFGDDDIYRPTVMKAR